MEKVVPKKDYFFNALKKLNEAINEEPTDVVIDGVLHRF